MLALNQIYNMDCLEGMKKLESDSIHCCITSPPYWALRDYGCPEQIGQEDTPGEYVERLLAVFHEVYRVLRPDGTFWLNIADTYCSSAKANRTGEKPKIKPKDLCGIPWALAFALRDAGWYLRQEIIWHKIKCVPESVTDRCVKAHESVFLFAKSRQYHFDYKAIQEPVAKSTIERSKRAVSDQNKYAEGVPGQAKQAIYRPRPRMSMEIPQMRNKRSVWALSPQSLKDAHFAAFPRALVEPCILAGCPVGGIVMDPFMGSGTTAMTAKILGRQYIGFEINPEYISISEKRIQKGK